MKLYLRFYKDPDRPGRVHVVNHESHGSVLSNVMSARELDQATCGIELELPDSWFIPPSEGAVPKVARLEPR